MALSAGFGDVWKAIGDRLTGNADLAAALTATGNQVIYAETTIPADLEFPVLRIATIGASPDTELSGYGKFDMRVQIDVFGTDPAANSRIATHIGELLDIPRTLPAGLTVSNWLLTEMVCRNVTHVGGMKFRQGGVDLLQIATDWNVRLIRTS